jgi:transposase
LQQAIQTILARHSVEGLLTVAWERHETTVQRQQGRGRPGPLRPTYTQSEVRYVLTSVQREAAAIAACQARLGWRVQVANAPTQRLSLSEAVCHYRAGWVLEHDFHLVKDLPLGLTPLFVWKDDQIKGMVRLLTLALRLLTLIEIQVRQALAVSDETLSGLYEGQPKRETERPSGKRLLRAFARAQISLICLETPAGTERHLTPLSPLLQRVLHYLRLPLSLYTDLAFNSS